jgi:very-short-patch-repair endonuclease
MKRPIIPYNPKLKERARELRNNSTVSERILWKYLKGNQILGYDFHRQRPVHKYIVDFFCQELYLGTELDGYSHYFESKAAYNLKRERDLKRFGIKIIRFWDDEIFNDINNVLRVIEHVIEKRESKFDQ